VGSALRFASRCLALAALGGTVYLGVALARVIIFSRSRRELRAPKLGITVLKPLHGLEPELEENLASFCDQEYPHFQVVFSAVDPEDPALAVARRVVERFPGVDAEIVVENAAAVVNPKIANALNGYARARYGVVALADADMRVGREYLRAIAVAFADEHVGAVTCLYGGVASHGAAAVMAAMFVNDHFAPSVLVAQLIEPLTYCFGSTMAVRRSVLEEIGGFAALGRTIADDYALGALVSKTGRRVELASCVAGNVMAQTTWHELWQRELRWARTIRAMRPLGSTFSVVTYALPLACIAWAVRPRSRRRLVLVAGAAVLRLALHVAARNAFAPSTPSAPHLILPRDALALAVWAASRFGRSARWHGNEVVID